MRRERGRFSPLSPARSTCVTRSRPCEQRAHPLEILGRVDAGRGRAVRDLHRDAMAVPERAQLLERLEALDRRGRERGEARAGTTCDRRRGRSGGTAEVASGSASRVRANASRAHGIGRAAEVQRVAGGVEHHLHHVGIEGLVGVGDRMAGGGDRGVRAATRAASAMRRISAGSSSGSSPCTLTTISSSRQARALVAASARRSVPVGWSATGQAHRRCRARGDGLLHTRVVGGDDHARRAALHRALRNPHHHRLAGDVGQRLARQARRRVARGNEDGERGDGIPPSAVARRFRRGASAWGRLSGTHSYSAGVSLRASSSSITGMPSRTG